MTKFLIYSIIVLSLTSCGPGIKITSDHDKNADFSKYSTYAFSKESATLPISDMDSKRLIDAIKSQLAAKGFTEAENPDLFVDLEINLKEKQTTNVNNSSGYRYRYYGPTTVTVSFHTEGTLFVSMIDRETNKLVWQGHGVGTYDPKTPTKRKESRINYTVTEMFKRYPPKANK